MYTRCLPAAAASSDWQGWSVIASMPACMVASQGAKEEVQMDESMGSQSGWPGKSNPRCY